MRVDGACFIDMMILRSGGSGTVGEIHAFGWIFPFHVEAFVRLRKLAEVYVMFSARAGARA